MTRKFLSLFILILWVAILTAQDKPNIVFILADDLSVDEKELYDIAQNNSEIVKELSNKLEEWVSTLPDSYLK